MHITVSTMNVWYVKMNYKEKCITVMCCMYCSVHNTVDYFGQKSCKFLTMMHSLIRGVLIQSCSTGAKNFTNYVFCHPQFSGIIQNIENRCAILNLFVYVDYYQNNQFYRVKNRIFKILLLWHNNFQYFG